MKIIKYGGNILKSPESRNNIYKQILNSHEKTIMIVSAFDNCEFSTKSLDSKLINNQDYYLRQRLITIGEIYSSIIVTNELRNMFVNCDVIYPEELGISVKSEGKMVDVTNLDNQYFIKKLAINDVLICPGFIGVDQESKIVSLNKGGSDLTAILVAKMLDINQVTLYKNVLGVCQADPLYFESPKVISNISYDHMIRFSKHGSKIVQLEALKRAKEYNIDIYVKHYLMENEGSLISHKSPDSKVVLNINQNDIYIDNFNDSNKVRNILFDFNIEYESLSNMNDYILIKSNKDNQRQIATILYNCLVRAKV